MTRPDARYSRPSWLPLVAAMFLATGCNNKTTVINQPAPPAPTAPSPGIPKPEGPTPKDEAEFLVQEAYMQGRQEGMREAWSALPEEERAKRKEQAEQRRENWMRRREQLRREVLTDILADKYGQKFEELVEGWKGQHPGESFECCKQEDEEVIEIDSPPEDKVEPQEAEEADAAQTDASAAADQAAEPADASAPASEDPTGTTDLTIVAEGEKVAGSSDNLDCWSRLCPSVAAIIEGPAFPPPGRRPPMGPRGPRPGGWMGAGPGAEVDLAEIGVTLPDKDPIPEEELMPLLEQAHAKGVEDGKAFAGKSEEERMEYHKQRWAEREQRVKERMQERLEERLAEAIEDCKAGSTGVGDCTATDTASAECNNDGGIGLQDAVDPQAPDANGTDAAQVATQN